MDNHFDFLRQAKPAGLYKLFERLPPADAATALAGLPAALGVQVMAYYPEERQAELMPILREARREGPDRAAAVAGRIREILAEARKNAAPVAPPPARANPYQNAPPIAPRANSEPPPSVPPKSGKPAPWIPRAATASPINGPALPGKRPPVSGDPLESPLARAGLLDLIGRAREKLLPGEKGKRPAPAKSGPGGRPPAVEGRLASGRIGVGRTPRVLGPKPAKEEPPAAAAEGGGARRMDGKAILAAILREAGGEIRSHVREDDPALFRELRGRMFHFDDLNRSDDAALARVFTAAPAAESALALRFAAPALRARVLRAVSPGRAAALREGGSGRAGVDDIEAAQKRVLDVALQLQARGRILIDPRDPDLAG